MSTRKIFAILVALSVLFAPGVGAAAMASPHHDMSMSMAGHCEAPPATSGDHDKAAGKNCCIAMCMAVAVAAPAAPSDARQPNRQIPQFAAPTVYTNSPHEIATPPPRHR